MSDTLTAPPDKKTSTAMQEAVQGDQEKIDQLFKSLMDHDVPAFVIRASLSPNELASVNEAVANRGLMLSEPLSALHEQARNHLEKHTAHRYKPLDLYEGKTLNESQANIMPNGRELGPHIDADKYRPPSTSHTSVILHTVTDGTVDVSAANYHYQTDPETGKPIYGTTGPTEHQTSLGAGDTMVFRQDGQKPTHHNFTSPDGKDRTSTVQVVRPVLKS